MSQDISLDVTGSQIKRWIITWIELAPRDRLSAAFIKSAKPGKHCDGAGLWFHKRADGGAQWFLLSTDMASAVIGILPEPWTLARGPGSKHVGPWSTELKPGTASRI